MRLTKIKLAGFKSFVEPTTIPFPGEMTAIVGPNGCGKSNVIDAVRWVLGESSAKNLRGDAMTDVIFNGSSSRKPVGQCSVELIFDNSQARVGGEYARYNELAIKRLVTREAQSTYFLNGTRCRRKDVTDIFLGTGLGPRSYAIIEQGMISRLIESKPQELRIFLEEAAGVSKYKERRRETENRIRHTRENLERLDDVRGELGRQLEKLQRQAAAAQRYKALKARQRQYKAELTAIRWLAHDEKIARLTERQHSEQRELDSLEAKLRGDEAGLIRYIEKAQDQKDTLDDLRQKSFALANDITRLEQNALHSKQRTEQINAEIDDLHTQQDLVTASAAEAQRAHESARAQVETLEPQCLTASAQLEQCEESLELAQSEMDSFSEKTRTHDSQYNEARHAVQRSHAQIQSALSMQLRTSQRISELKAEVQEISRQSDSETITELTSAISTLKGDIDVMAQTCDQNHRELDIRVTELEKLEQSYRSADQQNQILTSKLAALETLQEDSLEDIDSALVTPLWQTLTVPASLETAVESVLRFLHQPVQFNDTNNVEPGLIAGGHLAITQTVGTEKDITPGTLAHALFKDEPVPVYFNQIYLCSDLDEALSRAPAMQDKDLLLSRDGFVVAKGWIFTPGDNAADGAVRRQNQIATLSASLKKNREKVDALEQQRDAARQNVSDARQAYEDSKQALQQKRLAHDSASERKAMAVKLYERHQSELTRKQDELEAQLETEAQETAQLAQLSASLEEQEAILSELSEQSETLTTEKERLSASVSSQRTMLSQYQNQRHQLELALSQQQHAVERYAEQVTRNQAQLESYAARINKLNEELQKLSSPAQEQQHELQLLLAQRDAVETEILQTSTTLNELESIIDEGKKDTQSIAASIASRQQSIDSLTVDIESTRARGDAILEQMNGTGYSLKPVLASLDNNASDSEWQKMLEDTEKAITRLGAVNLAAVEEFEAQSTRKAHLDEQYADLNDALETLVAAIRKIDKETRDRFAETFNRVNKDVQTLFPKVFGGGSAYLELTDDDLLETGVTIMARPPGKKNSTIHLLSGGEKALTALSLVFAIFRLNPAPFCLLDEVDAPLDDANVGRFCNLVSEMSQTVQFIYITHNKIAMEMATHLTGVTMAEPGVSRMVAVDVDEAMAFVES
ncbi:chromosome segregation protein SMC [Salinimonas sp. HHU 13199]|uniref:Chromosome partition protein Smc n=1 Tax=Salinimonas profundi TaxID=2729140 RepID=A0ABR8LE96_9ALTE|nr:chromosome segregation protein SMC [Salinimonas profundi]MBD3584612.1 chromosome segregation protein SMC [Salinimonas profundi]